METSITNIRNRTHQMLFLNFFDVECPFGGRPSDIDFWYWNPKFVIFGEAKNEEGTFAENQTRIHEALAKNQKSDAYFLHIVHNKKVQNGDTEVPIGHAIIREVLVKDEYGCEWVKPEKENLTVNEWMLGLYKHYSELLAK